MFFAVMVPLLAAASCSDINRDAKESADVEKMHSCLHSDCRVCAAEFKAVKPPMPVRTDADGDCSACCQNAYGAVSELSSPYMKASVQDTCLVGQLLLRKMRAVYGYRLYLDIDGKDRIVPLDEYLTGVCAHDGMMTRRYQVDSISITERVCLDEDSPVAIFHYEWDGPGLRKIFADYSSDLGNVRREEGCPGFSLEYGWSPELNGMVVRDKEKKKVAILGANVPGLCIWSGRYDGFSYDSRRIRPIKTEKCKVSSCIEFYVEWLDCMDVVVAATDKGQEGLLFRYAKALREPLSVMP